MVAPNEVDDARIIKFQDVDEVSLESRATVPRERQERGKRGKTRGNGLDEKEVKRAIKSMGGGEGTTTREKGGRRENGKEGGRVEKSLINNASRGSMSCDARHIF